VTATLGVLRRISASRPAPVAGERCEMCAQPVGAGHSHVVQVEGRVLLCTCRGCYLLFSDERAETRYRAVPDRYLRFEGVTVEGPVWEELEIPVGLAFLFRNSVQGRVVCFYPGPAGATESELPLDAWDAVVAAHPELATVRPDVEALLIRRPACYLVPIDVCYELVGRLRTVWHGFDGGAGARDALAAFFSTVDERSVAA